MGRQLFFYVLFVLFLSVFKLQKHKTDSPLDQLPPATPGRKKYFRIFIKWRTMDSKGFEWSYYYQFKPLLRSLLSSVELLILLLTGK
jgi:hypothetical protein